MDIMVQTCQAPVSLTFLAIGLWNTLHNLNASSLISNILLTTAQNAANGYTDEKST